MPNHSNTTANLVPDLFHRNGVYFIRLRAKATGESLEVALHGISSEDKARVAAGVLLFGSNSSATTDQSELQAPEFDKA